jgi:large-conductance mechanosensitive channel
VKRNKYFDLEYVSLIKAIVLRPLIALKIFLTRAEKRIIKNTYNEFGEATGIEPTREEEFVFLRTLRDVLESYLNAYSIVEAWVQKPH